MHATAATAAASTLDALVLENGGCVEGRGVAGVPGLSGYALVLDRTVSAAACATLVSVAEETGFRAASLYTDAGGREHFSDARKSQRCILFSEAFAERLWALIRPYVPETWGSCRLAQTRCPVNECLRLLKYDVGDAFHPHSDGTYVDKQGAVSKITVLLYLNEGYTGAFTEFMDDAGVWRAIVPHVGTVVLQDQRLLHRVPPLLEGCKYVLRTEVMYDPPSYRGIEERDFSIRM